LELFPAFRCYLLLFLAAKGYPLQSGLSLPRGAFFCLATKEAKMP
jgi:hypothetical protein